MSTENVNLDFYAIGNFPQKNINIPKLKYNNAFKDTSNDIFFRNKLSLNSNKLEKQILNSPKNDMIPFKSSNFENNNYLNPLKAFKNEQKYNIDKNLVNLKTFRIERDKCFSKYLN
jgi:hypothetical protein